MLFDGGLTMRKFAALALSGLLLLSLPACRPRENEARAEELRGRYAALTAYTAAAEVVLPREEGDARYTLRFDADGEETRVTVLAPELLAGVTARLSTDALKLEYDGLVLDAGGAVEGLSAVNCVPLALRAAGGGYLLEQNEETFGDTEHALRLSLESEASGSTLRYTIWFAPDGAPLYVEIAENEEVAAFMEFTSFAFCDTIAPDGSTAAE